MKVMSSGQIIILCQVSECDQLHRKCPCVISQPEKLGRYCTPHHHQLVITIREKGGYFFRGLGCHPIPLNEP